MKKIDHKSYFRKEIKRRWLEITPEGQAGIIAGLACATYTEKGLITLMSLMDDYKKGKDN